MDTASWEDRDGQRWIQLEGELDHQACLDLKLRELFDQAVKDGDWDIVVVLDGVTFISSMAIGMLVAVSQQLRKDGRRLRVSGLKPNIRDLLDSMRILDVFEEI